jgi:hypothetical protein
MYCLEIGGNQEVMSWVVCLFWDRLVKGNCRIFGCRIYVVLYSIIFSSLTFQFAEKELLYFLPIIILIALATTHHWFLHLIRWKSTKHFRPAKKQTKQVFLPVYVFLVIFWANTGTFFPRPNPTMNLKRDKNKNFHR